MIFPDPVGPPTASLGLVPRSSRALVRTTGPYCTCMSPSSATAPAAARGARVDDVKDAAPPLFAERGHHGRTMSQIAPAVGVRTLHSRDRSGREELALRLAGAREA